MGNGGQGRNYRPCSYYHSSVLAWMDCSTLGLYRTEGTMYPTYDLGRPSDGTSRSAIFGEGRNFTSAGYQGSPMRLLSRWACNFQRWRREMLSDLHCAEEEVDTLAKRLHTIAGRAHVLEMEAYGETKPRRTLLPATTTTPPPPQC
jgi:hypothetical protein